MKQYTQSIKALFDGAENCQQVDFLMRYSAVNTIRNDIMELLQQDEYSYLSENSYAVGKLTLSLAIFRRAALEWEDDHKSLSDQIESARQNLNKFEGNISK